MPVEGILEKKNDRIVMVLKEKKKNADVCSDSHKQLPDILEIDPEEEDPVAPI